MFITKWFLGPILCLLKRSFSHEQKHLVALHLIFNFHMGINSYSSSLNKETVDSGVVQSTGLQIKMQISDVCFS